MIERSGGGNTVKITGGLAEAAQLEPAVSAADVGIGQRFFAGVGPARRSCPAT